MQGDVHDEIGGLMESVVHYGDQQKLVATSLYPSYAQFPFPNFNPVQSRVFEIFDKDCNALIAAATSAGKTVCAEMFLAHEVRVRGGTGVYLAPLKALAQEKQDDWSNPKHHFGDIPVSICTGDYRLTPERKKELEAAKLLVFSTEMLNSRCRNFKSESNEFLRNIGTVIVDESHLLTVPGRGDHLEVGLMKLAQIAPHARIIFLSATMPNVDEIAEWLHKLTKKTTYLIESTYRPCPLGIHYEQYFPADTYEETEREKVQAALQIVCDNPEDKHLIFAHTKRTGEMMKAAMEDAGYKTEFHNADLTKEKRTDAEARFKTGDLQIVVATSTLAWGVNMPARRVIILGMHRGMQEVDTYDIWQMAGRAGRPGYDPRGDVYILLPDHQANKFIKKLKEHQRIESRLLDFIGEDPRHYKTLAFHLISEIHHGNIKTKDEIRQWYERSLARSQAHSLDEEIIDSTLELLVKCGALKEENGQYKASVIGMISSMFYFSPFDVADLKRNFKQLFVGGYQDNDILVSLALGNVDSLRLSFVSKAERADMKRYRNAVESTVGEGVVTDPAIKGGFAYWCLMNGENPGAVANTARTLQWDFPRLSQVLSSIDSLSGKWHKGEFIKELQARITYGVGSKLIPLVGLPEIGKVRAEKLYAAGLRSPSDVAGNPGRVASVLNMSGEKLNKILAAAKNQALVS
jgi:replicative superfamily II helicase